MAHTNPDWSLSFALSAKNWADTKRAVPFGICPVFGLGSALRSLSSVALSSAQVPGVYHTPFSTLRKGDISTLHKRGHFYFALTRRKWDRAIRLLVDFYGRAIIMSKSFVESMPLYHPLHKTHYD